jgi:hypothetical protein
VQQRGDLQNLLLQQIWRKLQNDFLTGSAIPDPSYFLAQIDGKKAEKCLTMTTDNRG